MSHSVSGIFKERSEAGRAIHVLNTAGFSNDQIGVLARDHQGNILVQNNRAFESRLRDRAIASAAIGAIIGGLIGLGVVFGFLPEIGPSFADGTLATIFANSAGVAVITGLGGALIATDVSRGHALDYKAQLEAGRVVVTVNTDDRCNIARTILKSHGGSVQEFIASSPTEIQAANFWKWRRRRRCFSAF